MRTHDDMRKRRHLPLAAARIIANSAVFNPTDLNHEP